MYYLLFISSFTAATILPASSEVLLVSLALKHPQEYINLLLVATLGNSLGSLVTYGMGFMGSKFSNYLVPEKHQKKVLPWLQKYGFYSLFFSWLPVVGDALCIVAGMLKFPFFISSCIIFCGKLARYAILIYFTV